MARDFPGGVGNRLDCGDKAEVLGTRLSISFWAFWNAATANWALSKALATQYQVFTWSDGVIRTEVAGLQYVVGTPVTTRWSHYACTRDGTTRLIYLDGAQVGSQADANVIPDNASSFIIGGTPDASFGFDGSLAEMAIWDQGLTAAEVLALSRGVSPLVIRLANLKGYWPLQGLAFPEADLSGGQANAALVGSGITRIPHYVGGRYAPYGGC